MRFLLIVSLLFTVTIARAAEPAWPEPDAAFFTKLRMDYAKRPGYSPVWEMNEERDAVMAAMREKDYAKALKLGEAWLAKVPVDADMHYVCAFACKVLGDIPRRAYHRYYFQGLLRSITSSGDGKTPATAFKVISVAEEYYLLKDFEAEVVSQALEGKCDAMLCKVGGKVVTYYFDVSISLAAMGRELKPKK